MKQYIDKSEVVAEIKKRIKGLKDCHADTVAGYAGEISGLERLLSFLNTLEVTEERMINNGVIINGVTYEFATREVIEGDECMECALHERCHEMRGDILCSILFDDNMHRMFKRVEK